MASEADFSPKTKSATLQKQNKSQIDGLSPEQNQDLLNLFSNFDEDIINAQSFLHKIVSDVSVLDSANSHEILNSQEQLQSLLEQIDSCISEIDSFDQYLSTCTDFIQALCKRIQARQRSDYEAQLSQTNKHQLLEFVEDLIEKLSLSPEHVNALIEDKLRSALGIEKCVSATKALQKCLSVQLPPNIKSIRAVEEQIGLLEKNKDIFVRRFFGRMNSIFDEQVTELSRLVESRVYNLTEVHMMRHSELLNYSPLIHWVKTADETIFRDIVEIYGKNIKPIYLAQTENLIEATKQSVLSFLSTTTSATRAKMGDVLFTSSHQTSTSFNEAFDLLLNTIEPIYFAELNFCCHFFDGDGLGDEGHVASADVVDVPAEAHYTMKIMSEVFTQAGIKFGECVDFIGKQSTGLSLNMLVVLSTRITRHSKSFMPEFALPKTLVTIKQLFDRFIAEKINAYKSYKLKKNGGIVPHIADFYSFVSMAMSLMKSYSERSEVTKAFKNLVTCVFEFIESTAAEQPKTSRQHLVRLENYYRLLDVLKKLKIKGFDSETKEAKNRYDLSRSAYIDELLEVTFHKINEFTRAICARVDVGVKMADISYELAFSKKEARKLTKEYQSRKVFDSLEHIYRKVERQISKDANLLPVIWSFVREEFVRQFHYINNLFRECYCDPAVVLQFSFDDVTKFFDNFF